MIRRYQALVYRPDTHTPCSVAILVGTYRTAESAARRVERVLAKHGTRESRYQHRRASVGRLRVGREDRHQRREVVRGARHDRAERGRSRVVVRS
jgi:hypothetical protein